MKPILKMLACLVVALTLAAPALAADYDLVIHNGRVMDPETEFDGIRNVGIKDGKIAVITEAKISGKETIDATGLVVAPGFIDTQFHALDEFGIKHGALDGVTSALDTESSGWNISKWYEAKRNKWPVNYGISVSQEFARMIVHDGLILDEGADATQLFKLRAETLKDGYSGWAEKVSTIDEMNEITRLIDEQLRQGAIGLAAMVAYGRNGISTYELFEAQRAAARYGRVSAGHMRTHGNTSPPFEGAIGFDEMFANAVVLKAPLLATHNNDWGWWEVEEKLQKAREMGMNMWSEHYPYDAASTNIGAAFVVPESVEKILRLKYEDILYDPIQDKMLDKQGYLEVVKKDPGRTVILFLAYRKPWVDKWIRMPHMTVVSDAMWSGLPYDAPDSAFQGHPRSVGSRGKTLRLGRETGVPLMFQLKQLSYWSAKHLGDAGLEAMKVRGRIQEGMVADITIFDPKTVRDNATYKAGEQGLATSGFPYVIVNGTQVVKNSEFQYGVFPGQPIRYPVEEKGRFVPVNAKDWYTEHAVPVHLDDGHAGDAARSRGGQ